jgi:hypothetical protein
MVLRDEALKNPRPSQREPDSSLKIKEIRRAEEVPTLARTVLSLFSQVPGPSSPAPHPCVPYLPFRFLFSLAHLNADHFPAEDDFHATVLLPPGGGGVVGDRVGLAEPFGRDAIRR